MSGAGTPVQAVIFGGTTEGRQLADFCGQRGIRCAVCVVSSYGEELLPETEWVRRETGARTAEEMAKLLERLRPVLVLDATHPYAVQASENIRLACEKTGLDCLRVVRQSEAAAGAAGEQAPRIRYVRDAAEAAEALAGTRGPVFVTTGSKELYKYTAIPDYENRVYARVLSTAVAKEISRNLNGLSKYPMAGPYLHDILQFGSHKNLAKTRYVNDKQITDHYAIIPTGQGLAALNSVSATAHRVYDLIVRRFLSIFYPPAVYQKVSIVSKMRGESFFSNFKVLAEEGYLKVAGVPKSQGQNSPDNEDAGARDQDNPDQPSDQALFEAIKILKKGDVLPVRSLDIKEGETSPPKRYNSGSIILAMENAGQLIEDEELRAQIKGSGIGTSATRAEILKKLIHIKYLALNKKTQIITPTLQGEMVYDVVDNSIRSLLNPELTASWEKGLTYVAEGTITSDEYMKKLDDFITRRTVGVKGVNNQYQLRACYDRAAGFYKKGRKKTGGKEE